MTVRELIEKLLAFSDGDCNRIVRGTSCKDTNDEDAVNISITETDNSSCCLITILS